MLSMASSYHNPPANKKTRRLHACTSSNYLFPNDKESHYPIKQHFSIIHLSYLHFSLAFSLLPSAFCLLPSAFCLLPLIIAVPLTTSTTIKRLDPCPLQQLVKPNVHHPIVERYHSILHRHNSSVHMHIYPAYKASGPSAKIRK